MRVTGIIAEYNPFHLGHLYHLKQAKEISKSEGVIAIMSGSFLQRGEPALVDKWARTEMALKAGVDLVLELPVVFSCRSAYRFAQGGVKSLAATGILTHLAFGAETNNLQGLRAVARKLNNENDTFGETLGNFLDLGYSYPKSRTLTLERQLVNNDFVLSELDSPNNILAIAYLRVLEQLDCRIEPVTVQRIGSFHAQQPELGIASATAIRKLIENNDRSWLEYVPPPVGQILLREFKKGKGPVTLKALDQSILAVLRRMKIEEIKKIIEVSEGLENRLWELTRQTGNVEELLAKLKTKRYTYTRLQRLLIHAYLNFTQDLSTEEPEYLRVLGFNTQGKELLRLIKKYSQLPVITKFAQGYREVSEQGRKILDLEIVATNLYNLAFSNPEYRLGQQDFYRSPIIIE